MFREPVIVSLDSWARIVQEQPVLYCAVEMVSTPRDAASVIVAGREPSVMCPVPSVWILYAAAMEYALWAPVLVMEVIRGRTVRKLIAWIPFVRIMGFVFMANATAIKDGAVPIVKSSNPCALTSVLVMVLIFKSLEAAHVIPTGPGQTALLKSVQLTVALMECAWVDLADVKMGGQGLPVTRELVTLAAWNMARVKMGSVNVTKAGMGNTAQLKVARDSVTAMEDAL